jgi:hypothetical protein
VPQPAELVRVGSDVRGTQSFVHVIAAVFRRPSLVALEVAWRWVVGSIVIGVIALGNPEAYEHRFDAQYWRGFGNALMHGGVTFEPTIAGISLPVALIVLWAVISGLARDVILRRVDGSLHPRRAAVAGLAIVRVVGFAMLVAAWLWALVAIWLHVVREADPNYVLGFALVVIWTLVLFMLWSVVSWIFPVASTLAMMRDLSFGESLRAAMRSKALRSKTIEINLVMGIVKVALVVLAMVFSATPLPFQTYTTDGFLWCWWVAVAVLYLLASDFFHVVRMVACLKLCRAYDAG